jgi:hypothetical protein
VSLSDEAFRRAVDQEFAKLQKAFARQQENWRLLNPPEPWWITMLRVASAIAITVLASVLLWILV